MFMDKQRQQQQQKKNNNKHNMYIYICIITTKQTTTPSLICFFSSTLVRICISSPRTVLEGHPKKNPTVCQEAANGGLLSNSGNTGEHLVEKVCVMQIMRIMTVIQVMQVIQVVQVIQAMKVSVHVSAYTSQVGKNSLCFLVS